MSFKERKVTWAVLAVFLLAVITFLSMPYKSHAGGKAEPVIKLYSSGNLVQTWNATTLGEMDGETLVFRTVEGKMVRISGTFSAEETW